MAIGQVSIQDLVAASTGMVRDMAESSAEFAAKLKTSGNVLADQAAQELQQQEAENQAKAAATGKKPETDPTKQLQADFEEKLNQTMKTLQTPLFQFLQNTPGAQ